MASADIEKGSYSGFERFLFFVTPILFTAVLLGVLLLMLNSDFRQSVFDAGNKIPVVKSLVPDPVAPEPSAPTDEELTVANATSKVNELKALLSNNETALKQANEQSAQQKQQIEDLKSQIEQLNKANQTKTVSSDAYKANIASLAGMYSNMTPSKAAPILESMTIEEAALVLGAMSDLQRGKVLERMTPKKAADVTMKLKDAETVDNPEIAALQSRVKELEQKREDQSQTLDSAELNGTFSAMAPDKAAELLLQMNVTNPSKALRILGVLDDAARSSVLASMSATDKKTAAALVAKLMPANP